MRAWNFLFFMPHAVVAVFRVEVGLHAPFLHIIRPGRKADIVICLKTALHRTRTEQLKKFAGLALHERRISSCIADSVRFSGQKLFWAPKLTGRVSST